MCLGFGGCGIIEKAPPECPEDRICELRLNGVLRSSEKFFVANLATAAATQMALARMAGTRSSPKDCRLGPFSRTSYRANTHTSPQCPGRVARPNLAVNRPASV